MEFSDSPGINRDRWNTINFVPRKYRAEYQRYCFIIGSVFVALVLVITIITLVITTTSNSKSRVNEFQKVDDVKILSNMDIYSTTYDFENTSTHVDLHGKLLLLINGTELVSFNSQSRKLNLLLKASSGSVITTFDAYKYIYLCKKVFGNEKKYLIEAIALTKSDKNLLLNERFFKSTNLILDRVTENLYGVDEDAGNLVVMNLRKGYYAVLLKGLFKPNDIALDAEEGLIFILQFSYSTLRANMDGSQATEIVTSNNINALTIETNYKRLYWISNSWSIESSDYEGKRQKSFIADIMTIETLAVLDNRIFWTWSSFQYTTNLFSCEISENFTCGKHSIYNIPGNVTSIRGYSTVDKTIANPCELNNNGCEQLCLLSGRNKSTCNCHKDWQLDSDRHSCQELQ